MNTHSCAARASAAAAVRRRPLTPPPVLVGLGKATVGAAMALSIALCVIHVAQAQSQSNVLVPTIMRNTIGLSPFLVIVSLLVGAAAGGVVGALFAVPVAAAGLVILERAQARRVPVAQDAAAVDVSPEDADALQQTLPDAAAGKP